MSLRNTVGLALGALCLAGPFPTHAAPATGEFVRVWQLCGPFPARGVAPPVVENEGLLNPITHTEVAGRAWKVFRTDSGLVDLQSPAALGDVDRAVAFAYAQIESEGEGLAVLEIGSDDAVAAWWNGRRVLHHDVLRALHAGEDQVFVWMQRGRNELLLKVYDEGGGFGLAADLRPAGEKTWRWTVVAPPGSEEPTP